MAKSILNVRKGDTSNLWGIGQRIGSKNSSFKMSKWVLHGAELRGLTFKRSAEADGGELLLLVRREKDLEHKKIHLCFLCCNARSVHREGSPKYLVHLDVSAWASKEEFTDHQRTDSATDHIPEKLTINEEGR